MVIVEATRDSKILYLELNRSWDTMENTVMFGYRSPALRHDALMLVFQQKTTIETSQFIWPSGAIQWCTELNYSFRVWKWSHSLFPVIHIAKMQVKTRKEAKRMSIADSIAAAKAKTEELKKIVQTQTVRKDQYEAIISQQSLALTTLEEKAKEEIKHKEDIEDAISCYNKILGFRIETGHGIKFIFNQINLKDPHQEYSFTIRHADDTYSLLDCDPYLDDIKELIQDLNRTNGLYKFVRIMRDKFQTAASKGPNQATSGYPDSSTVSASAPASSISVDRSDSPTEQSQLQGQTGAPNRPNRKANHGVGKSTILSPQCASSVRRSSRLKVKK